ncbi:MAG TPA: hypothetical protein PLX02_10230 [Syntrophorhabdaceae bacterium]|nr:hypothetical protein [Syntrophorhabdaceae bacterium]HQM81984.1 hypothetical protein [Syntrophorhabdaceae bacterium]
MERFERITKNICKKLELVGVVAYLIMVLVNILDVAGSKFFKWPFPGSVEIVSFAQIIAISLTIPLGHILSLLSAGVSAADHRHIPYHPSRPFSGFSPEY